MQTHIKTAGLILIMLCYSACSTKKLWNRQKNNLSVLEKSETASREMQNIRVSGVKTISDSTRRYFELSILPVDSFQFSMEQGFKGKASQLTLRGSLEQVKHVHERVALSEEHSSESKAKVKSKLEKESIASSKSVEKKGVNIVLLCMAMGLVLVVIWFARRFERI